MATIYDEPFDTNVAPGGTGIGGSGSYTNFGSGIADNNQIDIVTQEATPDAVGALVAYPDQLTVSSVGVAVKIWFTLAGTGANDEATIYIHRDAASSATQYYYFRIEGDNNVIVRERELSTNNDLYSSASGWTADTSEHTMELIWDSPNDDLYARLDGTDLTGSPFTVTKDITTIGVPCFEVRNLATVNRFLVRDAADALIEIDNVSTDDKVSTTEINWKINGSGFGAD